MPPRLSHPLLLAVLCCLTACASTFDRYNAELPNGRYTPAITAARSISFSSDRAAALKSIAAKPDLDEPDQHRLVHLLASTPGFSSDNTDVAVILLSNPATTPSTKALIGDNADRIASFSSDRQRLATALAH